MGSPFIKGKWKYNETRRLLTFRIGGKSRIPLEKSDYTLNILKDAGLIIDEAAANRGYGLTHAKNCILCHGMNLISRGSPAPDLRESSLALDEEALGTMLKPGALASNDMPAYPELTKEDIRDIYMYIRFRARDSLVHPDKRLNTSNSSF